MMPIIRIEDMRLVVGEDVYRTDRYPVLLHHELLAKE